MVSTHRIMILAVTYSIWTKHHQEVSPTLNSAQAAAPRPTRCAVGPTAWVSAPPWVARDRLLRDGGEPLYQYRDSLRTWELCLGRLLSRTRDGLNPLFAFRESNWESTRSLSVTWLFATIIEPGGGLKRQLPAPVKTAASVAKWSKAPVCGTGDHGFESRRSPHQLKPLPNLRL